ncbi:MAG TPA: hypothetical protein PLH57_10135 [Oligoflexia bacterium]|nr:hypothetical protein [Oligoflexia bacterium]
MDRRPILFLLFAFFLIVLPSNSHARKFTNQFVEFELPLKWDCVLEGAEWVCQSTDENKRKDAIVVLAAKLKGDQDNLEKYQEYLGKPRQFTPPSGKTVTSQPKYNRISQINSHSWVDALHMESEIPNFYTRYLATVKQDIGVLVTYSINKSKYQDYQTQFDELVKSIRVFRKQGSGINTNVAGSIFNTTQPLNTYTAQGVFGNQAQASPVPGAESEKKPAKSEGSDSDLLILIAIVAGVGGYIYLKKKRGGGGPPAGA